MSNDLAGIDRCYSCGGLLKRLRDFDQAICRCDKPVRPGKKGRPPSTVSPVDPDTLAVLEEEAAARRTFSGTRSED